VSFGLVDDRFESHPKVALVGLAEIGLWTLALSWCSGQKKRDGFVPEQMLKRWGGDETLADALVAAGLWIRAEGGWRFHDWGQVGKQAISGDAKKAGGVKGAHMTNHVNKGVFDPECVHCVTDNGIPGGIPAGIEAGDPLEPGGSKPGDTNTYTNTNIPTTTSNVGTAVVPELSTKPGGGGFDLEECLTAHGLSAREQKQFLHSDAYQGSRNPTGLTRKWESEGVLVEKIAKWRASLVRAKPLTDDERALIADHKAGTHKSPVPQCRECEKTR